MANGCRGEEGTATILHADLDAFYASVEQLIDPSLRGRPIAVGGGVVLAASYEARAFGVQGGMAARQALRLCPGLRFVGGHFSSYRSLAEQVMAVFGDYTPEVERVSIDEAWLDVRGARHLFGTPAEIAAAIRRRVRQEIGLPLSIGVARTKHLAKIGSQVAKPDGLVVIDPARERAFLDPLPVRLIWGVGPVTCDRLTRLGIHTIGELAATRRGLLEHLLGAELGARLWALSRNIDPRHLGAPRPASSMSAQAALGRSEPSPDLLRSTLCFLADRVGTRLRGTRWAARRVGVRVRFSDMRSTTRARTLARPVSATLTLTDVAGELVEGIVAEHPAEPVVTLLAVSAEHLVPAAGLQLQLPFGAGDRRLLAASGGGSARVEVDQAVDVVRRRFGREAVEYAAVRFSEGPRVPEEFRHLAERS